MQTKKRIGEHRHYVVGFFFDVVNGGVLLINKTKPYWQRGLCNGLGGSMKRGETPQEAMVREFLEEAGVVTFPLNWQLVGTMDGPGWTLNILRTQGSLEVFNQYCDEGEIGLYTELPGNMETGARWLCLMCQDSTVTGARLQLTL